jgi:hypothetical protein
MIFYLIILGDLFGKYKFLGSFPKGKTIQETFPEGFTVAYVA